jgi:preprotein translocase subunit SecD
MKYAVVLGLLTAPGNLVFRIVPNGPTYRSPTGRPLRSADTVARVYGPAIEFKTSDAASFLRFTTNNVGRTLGIYLDGRLLASPLLQGAISDGGEISGLGAEDMRYCAAIMGTGPLPAPVRLAKSALPGSI